MATDLDAARFLKADLLERAVLLLQRSFANPEESASCRSAALAIAAGAGVTGPAGMILGASAVVGGSNADPRVLRLVSEAWHILESARLICRDLEQTSGDWWYLTGAGRQAQASSDPEGEIRLRLAGNP